MSVFCHSPSNEKRVNCGCSATTSVIIAKINYKSKSQIWIVMKRDCWGNKGIDFSFPRIWEAVKNCNFPQIGNEIVLRVGEGSTGQKLKNGKLQVGWPQLSWHWPVVIHFTMTITAHGKNGVNWIESEYDPRGSFHFFEAANVCVVCLWYELWLSLPARYFVRCPFSWRLINSRSNWSQLHNRVLVNWEGCVYSTHWTEDTLSRKQELFWFETECAVTSVDVPNVACDCHVSSKINKILFCLNTSSGSGGNKLCAAKLALATIKCETPRNEMGLKRNKSQQADVTAWHKIRPCWVASLLFTVLCPTRFLLVNWIHQKPLYSYSMSRSTCPWHMFSSILRSGHFEGAAFIRFSAMIVQTFLKLLCSQEKRGICHSRFQTKPNLFDVKWR